jgi:hypothetical protein
MMTLLDVEKRFWDCVQSKTPPAGFAPQAAPVPRGQLRTVDMTGNNQWASAAVDWLNNQAASKTFDKAQKELKSLVTADVGTASGHGITVKRNKAGSLTIGVGK